MALGDRHSTLYGCVTAIALGSYPASAAFAFDSRCADDSGVPSAVAAMFDPGGVRHSLAETGLVTGGSYIGEIFANSGGLREGSTYDGVLWTYLLADLGEMGLWKGLCVYADGYQIHGQSISALDIGSLSTVSSWEALPSTRLSELWFEQHLFDDRLTLRLGQLAADAEFLLSSGAGNFLNSTWGWATLPSLDLPAGGPSYPLATPGVRVALKPDTNWGFMIGVYNGDPVGPRCTGNPQICDNNGFDFRLDTPPMLIAEGSYTYNRSGLLPGTLKLGGWRDFASSANQTFSVGRTPATVAFNSGHRVGDDMAVYGILDQSVWKSVSSERPNGIALFGRAVVAPAGENLIDIYLDGGVTFNGLLRGREDDTLAIGASYSGLSDDAHAVDMSTGQTVHLTREMLLEVCYTAQLMRGWNLQPDFQYIWQPGGVSKPAKDVVPDAAVVGVRTTLNF